MTQVPKGITAWIDRAKPRSILCWTSPQHRGPWGDEGAGPTADKSARFSGFLHDWLGWQEGNLPHDTHYFSRSVVGVELIAV